MAASICSLRKTDYKQWLSIGLAIEEYVATGREIRLVANQFNIKYKTLISALNLYFGKNCKPVQMAFNTSLKEFNNLKIIN